MTYTTPTISSTGSRPRDVQVADIGTQSQVLRSRTWDRLKFEIEYGRRRGTTANSYLIKSEKIALIDPPGESFTATYLATLQQQINPHNIDYIITSHVNSNRIVTLRGLQQIAPQATLVCSHPAFSTLKKSGLVWSVVPVRTGDTLDLGQGHCLSFISVPTPRWPDGLCTYDPTSEILYSDKLFGSHFCGNNIWDSHWRELNDDRRYYFDCLQAPQAKQVEVALDQFDAFSFKILAPGHGPLVRHSLSRFRQDYRQWCQEQTQRTLRVAVLYASAYGSTSTIAHAIAQGLTDNGVAVEAINCEYTPTETLTKVVADCDGFIIGSPTLGGHAPVQIQTALGTILANIPKTKLTGVFGSYGWSGEAIDLLQQKLRDAGYRFGFEPIRVQFSPDSTTLKICQTAATAFAQQLRKRSRQQVPRQTMVDIQTSRTAQALGRIIGSLCVVTFEHHSHHRAILTARISQASFAPPGIMMALPMGDDAISSLQTQDSFVLNILKEGRSIRRHFSYQKSCQIPVDQLNTEILQGGKPIFTDALAYLEGTIISQQTIGSHLLVYAHINNGQVLDKGGLTAIHQL
ncbi:flavin oxidoreductase [Leptolyngbyaceae cyanobacterium CCMR0082]|uniref:Flavin oxidoreductase n=1 Tax=Adonisia turfae CCMR0082 TaxID=2304604 RepID=A0A6M0SBR5_9CYAN|nr:flavodoxin domain-containing protein [Adonisia turfae]NEZ65945.1 flavin oxidoreductase [Adonisia turfae CCMR0082]